MRNQDSWMLVCGNWIDQRLETISDRIEWVEDVEEIGTVG